MLSSLKYAVRSLAKTPWLTAVVIITVALGIAANTAVFSWTRGVLLNPFHGVADGRCLVSLETVNPTGDDGDSSYPDFRDYRDSSRSLAGAIAFQKEHLSLENGTEAERVWAELVSGNYFDVLGVRPAAGRFFRAEEQEEAPEKHPVAVISARFWRRHFHADPQVVGKTIRVNRQELTVVGVAPSEFLGTEVGLSFDLWMPLAMDPVLGQAPNWFQHRDFRGLRLLARLRPGVSLPEARTEIQTIARRLAQSYPKSNAGYGATLVPIDQAYWGLQTLIGTLLKTLLGAGAVLLLIVCANVANLMLVRATTRQKELSIRLALGASRQRVIGQLLLESLLLAGLGGLAGVLLAGQMGSWLRFFIPATDLPLALLSELRRELRSVDPMVHLFEAVTLSDFLGEARFAQKIGAALLGVLGALALLLAALGLFSVMAYSVSQRTQEIGIRMALGAQMSDVFRPVVGQSLRLAMAGIGIGLVLSFALTRLVASQLLGVSATDPLTFVAVSCLLCAVALAASIIPARRAIKVDPLIALRTE